MGPIGEEVEIFMYEYRESDAPTRAAKRKVVLLEFFKWEMIKELIGEIDGEAD